MGRPRHELTLLRSEKFNAVFSFGAASVDPILVSNQFVTVILEFSVFGQETVWNALERAAKPNVLFHTAIYLGIGGQVFKTCTAPLRRRPNGTEILCCNQTPKYMGHTRNKARYRCLQAMHTGARTFRITLLLEEQGTRWIGGGGGHDRFITNRIPEIGGTCVVGPEMLPAMTLN